MHQLFIYNIVLTPCLISHTAIAKHAFPTLVVLKLPQMCTWVMYENVENDHHSLHVYLTKMMRVGNLVWPSLNANRAQRYGNFPESL